MLLSNNNDLFRTLIKEAADFFRIKFEYCEKDYYAISILKKLIELDDAFIFKGGTSLSVCHKVINRFSEDIDVTYSEQIGHSRKKRVKQNIIQAITSMGLDISNIDRIRSRNNVVPYKCPYNSVVNNASDTVIIEWSHVTPAFPYEIKTAQTIVGKYLHSIGRDDLVKEYELEAFNVRTLIKERTMVDKIFAICDYYLAKKVNRNSRHIYDLHKLLPLVPLNENIIDLFKEVREFRKSNQRCLSSQDDKVISSLLNKIIESNFFKGDYENLTKTLLYDHVNYVDAINSLTKIMNYLKDNNL